MSDRYGTVEHQVSSATSVRTSGTHGLGLFATRFLTKGLLLVSERAVLEYETRNDAVDQIVSDFPFIPQEQQQFFTRLFAGVLDMAPLTRRGHPRHHSHHADFPLRRIARLNTVEGQGTGCFLSLAASAINHSCLPNAYIYFDPDISTVTLYSLRPIAADEEITINYLQSSVYLTASERHASIAN
ncbi:hypothetical protein F5Y15DRAFT_373794 [Xylariaceae sp. FL0016]|nr:hypothetical protein F5Y15DRAFT_373794 [Xylariaceae sp. FL0016]